MEEFFNLAYSTLILRPYVFAFLISYLVIAYLFFGWKRVLVYTLVAWFIAFLSEYSSITNGFPYGDYQYTYETMVKAGEAWKIGEKEFFVFGMIPFIDSLSYTFLSFIGYGLAIYLNSPIKRNGIKVDILYNSEIRHSFKVAILGAVLVTYMDIIIDPIATMGKKWFLGEMHYYVHPGDYFGVPITNTLGWFITALTIIFLFQRFDAFLEKREFYKNTIIPRFQYKFWFLFFFYLGIIIFMLSVTGMVGEHHLLVSSIYIQIPLLIFILFPLFRKNQSQHNHIEELKIQKDDNIHPC